ncbi:amino acid ABC transporter permease [Humibacter ginsenosidimutans]|uniref:Amino acid ABC transporter permease n=1 Tax=Humibacter ginsenosidimutans TaxID=2599293 RepID=A0A5B8M178_9MICO|nr:amino acid ABC transporter permease [Humibacter ginsenosidimutans]QDZ14568.1 amino acid ABC transporter permease [Humibacter ginsenosidimutans]
MSDSPESGAPETSIPKPPEPSTASVPTERAEAIKAVKLRHPWRIAIAVILIVLFVLFVLDAASRKAFDWPDVGKYLFDQRVSQAALVTLELTVYSMIIGIVLGLILAVMRLSPNPVLKAVAWLYLWVFRGTPVYVQLVFWGLITLIYNTVVIGIPFVHTWAVIPITWVPPLFFISVVGLSLNEAAYMAEIVRAGLLSVDPGQEEAAKALGMSWWQTMRRVVIPQSMRVIIPPTGNEVISMLKTTTLVAAVPFTLDLFGRTSDIAAVTFRPIPLLIVASLWYLFFTSILMVGQYFLERRFSRGVGRGRPAVGGGDGDGDGGAQGARDVATAAVAGTGGVH